MCLRICSGQKVQAKSPFNFFRVAGLRTFTVDQSVHLERKYISV